MWPALNSSDSYWTILTTTSTTLARGNLEDEDCPLLLADFTAAAPDKLVNEVREWDTQDTLIKIVDDIYVKQAGAEEEDLMVFLILLIDEFTELTIAMS